MAATQLHAGLGTEVRMIPLTPRRAEVRTVEQLTPRMVRIVLGGEDLSTFESYAPSDHFKLVLFPDGPDNPPARRDYTPRRWDSTTNELTFDLLLHGDGVVSSWGRQAAPGQAVGVAGPRGSMIVTPGFDYHLLLGDETTLPGIARWLEEAPAGLPVLAIIEVDDARDELPLPTQAQASVQYVHRATHTGDADMLLIEALRATDLPQGNGYIYAGAEAGALKHVRRYIINDLQHPRAWMNVTGHWKRGEADHDHHAPIEE